MDTPVPLVLQARTMHRVVCFIRCIIIIYIYIILYHLEYNAYYVVEYIYTPCIDVCIRLDAYIPPHKCLSFARLFARTRGLHVSGRVDAGPIGIQRDENASIFLSPGRISLLPEPGIPTS